MMVVNDEHKTMCLYNFEYDSKPYVIYSIYVSLVFFIHLILYIFME